MKKLWLFFFPLMMGASFDATKFTPQLITPYPDITTTVGQPINWNLGAHIACVAYPGDPQAHTWTINNPAGTTLNNAAGSVTGIAQAATETNITVSCLNASGNTVSDTFHLSVISGGAPVVAQGYFVECGNGSDAAGNPGTNPSAPLNTLARARVLARTHPGADVWEKVGSICPNQNLLIDWSGTSVDPVIFGTYYTVSGVAYQNTPSNPTAWPTDYIYSHGARAQIDGTCPSTGWDDPTCKRRTNQFFPDGGDAPSGTAVPNLWTLGLVEVEANWVVVQDLNIFDSAGYGILVPALGGPFHDVTMQRNYIYRSFNAAARCYVAQRCTFKNNVVRYVATSGNPDFGPNPALLAFDNAHSSTQNDHLIEGNDLAQSYGGGIQIFYAPKGLIIRGNRIGDIKSNRPCVYGDDGDDIVLEYNLCYGGGYVFPPGVQDPTTLRSRGFAFTFEGNASCPQTGVNQVTCAGCVPGGGSTSCAPGSNKAFQSYVDGNLPLTDLLIRGNMFAGTGNCVQLAQVYSGTKWNQSARIYNNTCYSAYATPIDLDGMVQVGSVEIKNNILDTPSPSTRCPTMQVSSGIVWDYNLWNGSLPPAACRGTNDMVGTALLAGSNMGSKNSTTNPVVPDDFALQGTSPVSIGIPLQLTLLSASDYPQAPRITYPCAQFDLKGSSFDARCVARSIGDTGAREQ